MSVKTVRVKMWGTTIGYLHQQDNGLIGFQYDENFISSGIEVSPIKMPLSAATYAFPSLNEETYKGLPGMLAMISCRCSSVCCLMNTLRISMITRKILLS